MKRRIPIFAAALTVGVLWFTGPAPTAPQSDGVHLLSKKDLEAARKIMAKRRCPCGCGRYLPGSRSNPACFGCSVGKADVSRIVEGVAAGRETVEIILELDEPTLVDVFADYTNDDLPAVWRRARRVAGELNQHRVVLRTPGRSAEARRAVKLVECARAKGKFGRMQEILIRHRGPWDEDTLVELAGRAGLERKETRRCLGQTNVRAQINKDREHARLFGVKAFPAVAVNREVIGDTERAIRRAIRELLKEGSI